MTAWPPLAIYVHMPWCVRKCPYCDFNSHRAPADMQTERYVDALIADLDSDLQVYSLRSRPITSVFMGGGTPSLFEPTLIARLLDALRARAPFADDAEVTLEANPGTIERGAFADYRAAGVNRVSLGVQSFSNGALQRLGRIHNAGDVHQAVNELQAAGLTNFNLDLMYALPHQSLAEAVHDVDTAISLRPAHISHYELTLEPGTVFHRRPPEVPDAETAWQMQIECQARLHSAGFEQYEVSAYAPSDRRCRHNLNYWTYGDYLGLGAGAHGKLTLGPAHVVRTIREKQPRTYLNTDRESRVSRHAVAEAELPFEFMLNSLRLTHGVQRNLFSQRTGCAEQDLYTGVSAAVNQGLLEETDQMWIPTERGRGFLNDLQALFLPHAEQKNVASS